MLWSDQYMSGLTGIFNKLILEAKGAPCSLKTLHFDLKVPNLEKLSWWMAVWHCVYSVSEWNQPNGNIADILHIISTNISPKFSLPHLASLQTSGFPQNERKCFWEAQTPSDSLTSPESLNKEIKKHKDRVWKLKSQDGEINEELTSQDASRGGGREGRDRAGRMSWIKIHPQLHIRTT